MKITIMGTGSWGTALAQVLADNHQDVLLYGINPEQIRDINENHRNTAFFETPINENLRATDDISCVKDADIVLLAVPSQAIESVVVSLKQYLTHPVIVINVAKGFHPVTHERLSEIVRRNMDEHLLTDVVSLIGPSHAEEVILRLLTAVNAVCIHEESAKIVQNLFANDYFRVYTNTDEIGAEIGVSVKNVMAIASGILHGLGQGDNARAALMTRGLAEMTRYGVSRGGRQSTFLGLDGVGDLIVTCTSFHSRNFMAGYAIGKADSAEEFLRTNKKTVEGIAASKVLYEESKKNHISMPITEQVYKILYEGKIPSQAIHELMLRDLKPETI